MSRLKDLSFPDLYLTPDGYAFIHDHKTAYGLRQVTEAEDINEIRDLMEKTYQEMADKKSSFAVKHDEILYRVERIESLYGIHYTARRFPKAVPNIANLGYQKGLVNHLCSLTRASGLIIVSGATGSGKTTTLCSLLRYYLETEGGFAYTIEDPPEMPLDGYYQAINGSLGLCKQTEPPEGKWEKGIMSALRSHPKYILVGEIRTPETASQLLRAATSGHLVLSTIHANGVEDTLTAISKYAISSGMDQDLAFDLLARGFLGVINQRLMGVGDQKYPEVRWIFANPNLFKTDQVRVIIRSKNIVLGTVMEQQQARLMRNMPIIEEK